MKNLVTYLETSLLFSSTLFSYICIFLDVYIPFLIIKDIINISKKNKN